MAAGAVDQYCVHSGTNGMPVTSDAFQDFTTVATSGWGAILVVKTDLRNVLWRRNVCEHVDGGTSRFDKNGTVYKRYVLDVEGIMTSYNPGA